MADQTILLPKLQSISFKRNTFERCLPALLVLLRSHIAQEIVIEAAQPDSYRTNHKLERYLRDICLISPQLSRLSLNCVSVLDLTGDNRPNIPNAISLSLRFRCLTSLVVKSDNDGDLANDIDILGRGLPSIKRIELYYAEKEIAVETLNKGLTGAANIIIKGSLASLKECLNHLSQLEVVKLSLQF